MKEAGPNSLDTTAAHRQQLLKPQQITVEPLAAGNLIDRRSGLSLNSGVFSQQIQQLFSKNGYSPLRFVGNKRRRGCAEAFAVNRANQSQFRRPRFDKT